jgi:uncharacterized protein YkwD
MWLFMLRRCTPELCHLSAGIIGDIIGRAMPTRFGRHSHPTEKTMKSVSAWALAMILTTAAAPVLAGPVTAGPESEVLALINQERARKGCGPLTMNTQLSKAAARHAEAMAREDFFSHTGANGSTLRSRTRSAGYHGRSLAENIAAGYATPAQTVEKWMASPGHRENILTCKYTETGIGLYYDPDDAPLPGQKYAMKYYWVQDFGRR